MIHNNLVRNKGPLNCVYSNINNRLLRDVRSINMNSKSFVHSLNKANSEIYSLQINGLHIGKKQDRTIFAKISAL